MKVIREISKSTTPRELDEIYERGHKIAVKYAEDTLLAFADCIVDDKGDMCLDDVGDVEVKDYFVLKENELYAKGGELVVIDSILYDKTGCLAECEVTSKEGRVFVASYCLLDENIKEMTIAGESVYEVE